MFHVVGSEFTLENIIVDASNETENRTIVADSGAEINLKKGAEISGNTSYGAIYMDAASLNIDGGAIKNNSATKGEVNTKSSTVAGAYSAYTYTSEYGGQQPLGGAVLMVNKSSFEIRSGEIRNNTALSGGAIYASNLDAMLLLGGDISYNSTYLEADTNKSLAHGGAIGIEKTDACNVKIDGTSLTNNKSDYNGAALYIDYDVGAVDLVMTSGTFSDNEADRNGATICCLAYNPLIDISGSESVFDNNSSATYGGLYITKSIDTPMPDSDRGTLNIHDGVSFTRNTATYGSCLSVTKNGSINNIVLKNCAFQENSAKQHGGAFYASLASCTLTIDGGTYTNNHAGWCGGAFYTTIDKNSLVTVDGDALFTNNSADANAGAFSLKRAALGNGGKVELVDCNVTENWCNANFENFTGTDLVSTQHYNTGGIYVGENITLNMKNAEVTNNDVQTGFNGQTIGTGIGVCPHGTLELLSENGLDIHDNGNGKGMDILAVPWDEVIDHEVPSQLIICDTTPDGKDYNWTDLNGDEARTGLYTWDAALKEKEDEINGIATMALETEPNDEYTGEKTLDPVGFKANIDKPKFALMSTNGNSAQEPSVIISNNYTKGALYGGGGMMVNGTVIAGEFSVKVSKTLDIDDTVSQEDKAAILEKDYRFNLIIEHDDSFSSNAPKAADVQYTKKTVSGDEENRLHFEEGEIDGNKNIHAEFSLKGSESIEFKFNKNEINIINGKDYEIYIQEVDSGDAARIAIKQESYDSFSKFEFDVTNYFYPSGDLSLTKTLSQDSPEEANKKTYKFEILSQEEQDSTRSYVVDGAIESEIKFSDN